MAVYPARQFFEVPLRSRLVASTRRHVKFLSRFMMVTALFARVAQLCIATSMLRCNIRATESDQPVRTSATGEYHDQGHHAAIRNP